MRGKQLITVSAVILIALVCYLLDLRVVLPLALVVLGVRYLPVPTILSGILGRLLASVVVNFVLLQLAGVVQFFLFPTSDFTVLAVLYAVLSGVFLWLYGRSSPVEWRIADVGALIGALIFALPFAAILTGQDSLLRIVQLGGLQSPDAGHHFGFITGMAYEQHLDASGYPKSFHLSVAFWQEAILGQPYEAKWGTNVALFFGHYLLFGTMLAMASYYVVASWVRRLMTQATRIWTPLTMAVALALPLCLLILWPFVVHGFLNYTYTLVALMVGVIYAGQFLARRQRLSGEWFVLTALLFFSASLSWTLITPAVMVVLFLMIPLRWRPLRLKRLLQPRCVALGVVLLLQAVPVVLQLLNQGTSSVNDLGDLRELHTAMLLMGVVMVGMVVLGKYPPAFKRMITDFMLPFMCLAGGIALLHFFMFGEARYFSIKVGLLVEAFALLLGVALLFVAFINHQVSAKYLVVLPLVPLIIVIFLLGTTQQPLKDVRDLFRDQSGQGKPAFYDGDIYHYTWLGKAEQLNRYNSTTLHYNAQDGKITGHTLLTQWAHTIKYARDADGLQARSCHKEIYSNTTQGNGAAVRQADLLRQVRECAALAAKHNQVYYVITDTASISHLKRLIGDMPGIVYVGG